MDDTRSPTLARLEQAAMNSPMAADLRQMQRPRPITRAALEPDNAFTLRWPGVMFVTGGLVGAGVVAKVLPRFKVEMPSFGHKVLFCIVFGMMGFLCGVKVNDYRHAVRVQRRREALRRSGLQTDFWDDELRRTKELVEQEDRDARVQYDTSETWSEAWARMTKGKDIPVGMDHQGRTPA
eukprot:GGOE01041179.1.p2 GENE.GGOE01041179.1~~GGOE01041179.1.p2  ORF type:complete len:193 (+),score=54.43 GGOE01041179.1:42-581(+)